jgi:bacillithiol system protein YtxJ
MSNLTHLFDLAGLEAAFTESLECPVILFKHSRNCGVSCEALDELHAHAEAAPPGAAYKVITVQSHRQLADEVTVRLGIRHETPQAILLRNGQPVWSASHFRITARQLDAILQS